MSTRARTLAFALIVLALCAAGCGAPSGAATTYDDPFAYCAAVGTADAPDARYTGEEMPEAIILALRAALETPADAPMEWFTRGTFWRCMEGQVYGCFVGANLPCEEKVDLSQTPSDEMKDFCKESANANADAIPAAVTGRATAYQWRCSDGAPAIVRQMVEPDAQGYQSNIWYALTPPAP